MSDQPDGCRRDAFRIPDHVHYLNCAYMSPLPVAVEEAVVRGLRRKRLPTDLHASDFFDESDAVRERFARLVGEPDPRRIALHPSVSYGIATAARNLPLPSGSSVILLGEQFPGDVYAWRRKAAETGADIVTVPRPDSATPGAAWNEALLGAVTDGVAVVMAPTVHWTDGTRFDLEALGRRCHEVGAALVVDGTQSVGAVPFHLDRVRPAALVVAAYKWLLGPYSLALTWLGADFDDGVPLEETWIGRAGSDDFQGLVDYVDEYQPGAIRYDVGERSNFALLPGLLAALDLVLEWGPERVSGYARRLGAPLLERAAELGYRVEDEAFRSPHIYGLRMPPGIELPELKAALEDRRVYVSLRGSSMRVSAHLFNTAADVEALARALAEARA